MIIVKTLRSSLLVVALCQATIHSALAAKLEPGRMPRSTHSALAVKLEPGQMHLPLSTSNRILVPYWDGEKSYMSRREFDDIFTGGVPAKIEDLRAILEEYPLAAVEVFERFSESNPEAANLAFDYAMKVVREDNINERRRIFLYWLMMTVPIDRTNQLLFLSQNVPPDILGDKEEFVRLLLGRTAMLPDGDQLRYGCVLFATELIRQAYEKENVEWALLDSVDAMPYWWFLTQVLCYAEKNPDLEGLVRTLVVKNKTPDEKLRWARVLLKHAETHPRTRQKAIACARSILTLKDKYCETKTVISVAEALLKIARSPEEKALAINFMRAAVRFPDLKPDVLKEQFRVARSLLDGPEEEYAMEFMRMALRFPGSHPDVLKEQFGIAQLLSNNSREKELAMKFMKTALVFPDSHPDVLKEQFRIAQLFPEEIKHVALRFYWAASKQESLRLQDRFEAIKLLFLHEPANRNAITDYALHLARNYDPETTFSVVQWFFDAPQSSAQYDKKEEREIEAILCAARIIDYGVSETKVKVIDVLFRASRNRRTREVRRLLIRRATEYAQTITNINPEGHLELARLLIMYVSQWWDLALMLNARLMPYRIADGSPLFHLSMAIEHGSPEIKFSAVMQLLQFVKECNRTPYVAEEAFQLALDAANSGNAKLRFEFALWVFKSDFIDKTDEKNERVRDCLLSATECNIPGKGLELARVLSSSGILEGVDMHCALIAMRDSNSFNDKIAAVSFLLKIGCPPEMLVANLFEGSCIAADVPYTSMQLHEARRLFMPSDAYKLAEFLFEYCFPSTSSSQGKHTRFISGSWCNAASEFEMIPETKRCVFPDAMIPEILRNLTLKLAIQRSLWGFVGCDILAHVKWLSSCAQIYPATRAAAEECIRLATGQGPTVPIEECLRIAETIPVEPFVPICEHEGRGI
ncbi:MAG: hypothetical protein LBJ89_00540 [Holosporales bacterium]|nr:hypothetical protein [Holosporales bacterium]